MGFASRPQTSSATKRLAIIGGGSSGLITLKYALDELPDWEVICFEKSNDITGCWGRPPNGFVSTSTKYATQFACFAKYDAQMHRSEANPFADFFQDEEYGDYLLEFANAFDLTRHITRNCEVLAANRESDGQWKLTFENRPPEYFSHAIICTGLVDQPKPIGDCPIRVLQTVAEASQVKKKCVVVVGGGESAVDIATRVSKPELGNQVYLSLRSGVRVSPRYHPIRGVPSDFLRTRLLLANHPDVRNAIGQKFVEFRIKATQWLQWLFPGSAKSNPGSDSEAAIRRRWDMKLTRAAKDRLFNVYHNKSDEFLDSVARGEIKIIGANIDESYLQFFEYQSKSTLEVTPDLLVPAIGYRSTLSALFDDRVSLEQFFMGCLHCEFDNLGAVGFTRPIIGNIPSISEMQARFLCGVLAGRFACPEQVTELNLVKRSQLEAQFPHLDCQRVYPVEMFPYCDELARLMDCFPSIKRTGSLLNWWRMMRAPATTMHYFEKVRAKRVPVHSPWLITWLLLLAKPIDWAYRLFRWIWPKRF